MSHPPVLSYASMRATLPNEEVIRRGLWIYGGASVGVIVFGTVVSMLIMPLLVYLSGSYSSVGATMAVQAWVMAGQRLIGLLFSAVIVWGVWWFTAPAGSLFSEAWRWGVRGAALVRLGWSVLTLPLTAVSVYSMLTWESRRGMYSPGPWWPMLSRVLSYGSMLVGAVALILIVAYLARLAGAVGARGVRIQWFVVLGLSLALTAAGWVLQFLPLPSGSSRTMATYYMWRSWGFGGGNLLVNTWQAVLVFVLAARLRPVRRG